MADSTSQGEGNQPKAPPTFPTPPKPSAGDLQPLIIPPSDNNSPNKPQALLVLLCGALLYPKDYKALTDALLEVSGSSSPVGLWTAVTAIDWPNALSNPTTTPPLMEEALQHAVKCAVDQGFSLQETAQKRFDNVFVGLHSFAVLAAGGMPMQKAAGTILLGATFVTTNTFTANARTFPRPLLHIFGQLDGQTPPAKAGLAAVEAAVAVHTLGPRAAARTRPIVIIRGMNHGQMSNGVVNSSRGDLQPEISNSQAAHEMASALIDFVAQHTPGLTQQSQKESVEKSLDSLMNATLHAAAFLSPYVEKLGRPTPAQLLCAGHGATTPPLALSHGAERIPFTFTALAASTAHPGEMAVAQRFAENAQRRLLRAALPADVAESITVAAVVHTTPETFTYNHSVIMQTTTAQGDKDTDDVCTVSAGWAVQIHVLIDREAYSSTGAMNPSAMTSPAYSLKLKAGEQVAAALGVQPISQATSTTTAAAALNAVSWQEALAAAPDSVIEIFNRRGCVLEFIDDEDVSNTINTPKDWIAMPLKPQKHVDGPGSTHKKAVLKAPVLHTHVSTIGPFDSGSGRYAGVCYLKCVSVAWMLEYMMTAGLRY